MKINIFVFDTNVLISSALIPYSSSRRALDKGMASRVLASSDSTYKEFVEVLFRKKFNKYFKDDEERWTLIYKLEANSKLFTPDLNITDCRDPKDNKFLELAIAANANCLVTGDSDLLVLNPFRNIPILNAADFLGSF